MASKMRQLELTSPNGFIKVFEITAKDADILLGQSEDEKGCDIFYKATELDINAFVGVGGSYEVKN